MSQEIENFRLKLRNTQKLKRSSLTFTEKEAKALNEAIKELEKQIEKLEKEVLRQKTLTIDIIGSEF